MVEKGFGDHVALIGNGRRRTYKELLDWTNRLAHTLVEDFGVKPGNRVLIRSGNNPAMVAAWLAVTKAGAVAVNTMPMLRAGELTAIVDKAQIGLGALRQPHRRRAGGVRQGQPRFSAASSASMAPRITMPSSIVSRSTSRCTFDAVQNRTRRRRAARIHVRHDRRAQGDRPLPSRSADHRRRLREGSAASDAAGHLRRLAAAGVHLRPGRPRHLPAALRRDRDASRERVARQHDRHHRNLQGDDQLHVADRLPRDDGGDGRRRGSVVAANGRFRGRDAAGAGLRGLDEENRKTDSRRHRHHRTAAHLHQQPPRGCRAGRDGPAGDRVRGQRSSTTR